MMQVLSLFMSSFIVALSGALVPGPLTISAIERAMRYGAAAALFVALGHSAIELPTTVLLSLGLHLADVKLVKVLIGIIGGSVLTFMGISMIHTMVSVNGVSAGMGLNRRAQLSSLLAGVTSSLSNPYWFVWWLTVGASMISFSLRVGTIGVSVFYVGHILGDIIWLMFVSIAVDRGISVIGGNVHRALIKWCGIFMIVFGFLFIVMALRVAASYI